MNKHASPSRAHWIYPRRKSTSISQVPILVELDTHHRSSSLSLSADIFNKQTNIKDIVVQALGTISKDKKTQLLSEEDYFIRKMSGAEYQKNLFDHYRAYNDLLLPNLNVLPKNVKDVLVLFALDHADALMLNILKQHCCIPCTPNGRILNKPSKLIHPHCRLASLYSDIDSLFPYGGQDSYLRDDRLNVLKLLGKLKIILLGTRDEHGC